MRDVTENGGDNLPAESPPPPNAVLREPGADLTPTAYAPFGLADSDLEKVSPREALREDGGIGPYLKTSAPDGNAARLRLRAAVGFLVFAAALFCLYAFPEWRLLGHRYAPPTVRETPTPQAFTGNVPLQFREAVEGINNDIEAGDRWRSVFDKLTALTADLREASPKPPRELPLWAATEALAAVASRNLPPGVASQELPGRLFGEIAALSEEEPKIPVPYRAASAYAKILHGGLGGNANRAEALEPLLTLLERVREEHAAALNKDAEMLAVEADSHVLSFPATYAAGDPGLDYHWRMAAHAVNLLYAKLGGGSPVARALDRKRWEAVYAYFSLTLFTMHWEEFWRLEKIELDGRTYTRDGIQDILEKL